MRDSHRTKPLRSAERMPLTLRVTMRMLKSKIGSDVAAARKFTRGPAPVVSAPTARGARYNLRSSPAPCNAFHVRLPPGISRVRVGTRRASIWCVRHQGGPQDTLFFQRGV